jgi:uncharacterized membrane protein affecting hemolysin expression
MKINILNLKDFGEINKLCEGFNYSTDFLTAIYDPEGNILSKSGSRQMETGFHHKLKVLTKKSSRYINRQMTNIC